MTTIYASPLQGYTDYRFRSAFRQFFGGVDHYMAPYIRLDNNKEIKAANMRDLLPANNQSKDLIPQIITRDADEFLFVSARLQELGYDHLNWNLGCPYPMVAKRGLGSGLLKNPEKIDEVLKRVVAESGIRISVKMRLGYEEKDEIDRVLPVLDNYPLDHIAIHPRLGRQLYKGEVYLDDFARCLTLSRHNLVYNGDITSVQVYREMKERFPEIENWMIGRGLIADPFLPTMIKDNTTEYPENRSELFSHFHDALLASYSGSLSGTSQILMKMYYFWEYFILSFPEAGKGLKKIKKARSIEEYQGVVRKILDSSR